MPPQDNGAASRKPRYTYFTGISASDLHSAPYHQYLQKLPQRETGSLLGHGYPRTISSFVSYQSPEGSNFGSIERFSCSLDNGIYQERKLNLLRGRYLESSVPAPARIVSVENLAPLIVELLGSSLNLLPRLFVLHVRDMWRNPEPTNLLHARFKLSSVTFRPSSLLTTIQYPRMINGPFNPKTFPSWFSNCRNLFQTHEATPYLFRDGPGGCNPSISEHLTVEINLHKPSGWTGILLFPPSDDQTLYKSPKMFPEPPPPQASEGKLESYSVHTHPGHFGQWKAECEVLHNSGYYLQDPFVFLASVYIYSLGYWESHLERLDRVVNVMGEMSGSGRAHSNDTDGIYPQQRLKEHVIRYLAIVEDTMDCIKTISSAELDTSCAFQHLSSNANQLRHAHARFQAVRTRLERHLPTIQHHIDLVLLQQQVQLAQTQLLESQKAIQQADTIKRLTILAFIFIPISTVSSIFGMNIKELEPNPSIWVFAATAAALFLVTVLAASFHWCIEKVTSWSNPQGGGLLGMGFPMFPQRARSVVELPASVSRDPEDAGRDSDQQARIE